MSKEVEPAVACEEVARNPLAIVLWVIVGSGLLYGISQTAITAAGLFTG